MAWLRGCRVAKEEALQNWRMAVAFWEISLARRCFRHLARHTAATTAAVGAHVRATTLRRTLRCGDTAPANERSVPAVGLPGRIS
jgi:hypothetical protein